MRGMLRGEEPSAPGPRYATQRVRDDPLPLQRPLPILVGGGGEKVTLKLVAKYADANNVGGTLDNVKRKESILRAHCADVGRDHAEIERTSGRGVVVIRDSRQEARAAARRAVRAERRRGAVDGAAGRDTRGRGRMLAPFVALGYRHLIFGFPAPYDEESMTRLSREVKPRLEQGT